MTQYNALGIRPYEQGLIDLGNGAFAWLQPDGGWGWSNAGLVTDGDQSLLVDTLFDKQLTGAMLRAMAKAATAARDLDTVINTHSNGDHCNGNELVGNAQIIASEKCAEELASENPAMMAKLIERAPSMGETGEFFLECFGQFQFAGIEGRVPDRTFTGSLDVSVGDKVVHLTEVGPAHTGGDVLVHVPADRIVFTGDILFIEGHPIMWAGPVGNWIRACEALEAMDVDLIVPGHGPVTDQRGPRAVAGYLRYIAQEARRRFDAGMEVYDAAQDIALDDFDSWGDAERIVVNTATLFKEFAGDPTPHNTIELFALMARIKKARISKPRRR